MEKQERPAAPPPRRRGHKNPSFSSSLLDAIYRSIDDSEGGTPRLCFSSAAKQQRTTGDDNLVKPPQPPPSLRRTRDPAIDRCHRRFFSTSGSSDCSSFGGFSSSDADSTARPGPILTRSDRIRSVPQPPPPVPAENKKPGGSIGSRIRDLRKSRSPASPGSRLAAFLNAIFSSAGGSPKKPKLAGGGKELVSSSASSSKDGSGKQPSQVKTATVRDAAAVAESAGHRRKMAEEMLRGMEMEEESDCESVSSSDLFELESLSVIGRFTDELPVYETTNLGTNRAIAHGLVV